MLQEQYVVSLGEVMSTVCQYP